MAFSSSSQFREHEKHAPSAGSQQRRRSSSQRLSKRHPSHLGMPKAGQAVQIFSRSSGAWVDGFITEVVDDNLVWVEYQVGEEWHGKLLHISSEHLVSTSIMDDAYVEEHDLSTKDDPLLQEHDPEGGFWSRWPIGWRRREKWLTAGEKLLGMEVNRCESTSDDTYIDMNDSDKRWGRTDTHVIEVEDSDSSKCTNNLYMVGSAKVNIRLSKVIDVDEDISKQLTCTIKSPDGRVLLENVGASLCAGANVETLKAAGEIETNLSRELGDGEGKLSFEFSAPLLRIALKKHDPPAGSTYVSSAILGCKCKGEVLVHGGMGIEGGVNMKAKANPVSARENRAHFKQRKGPLGYQIKIGTVCGPEMEVEHNGKTMQEVLAYLQTTWLAQARKKPETWRVLWIGVHTDDHAPARGCQEEAQFYNQSNIISASSWSASEFEENLDKMQECLPSGHCLVGHLTSKDSLRGIIGPENFGLRAIKPFGVEHEVPFVFVIRHVSKIGWEQYGRHPFPERAGKAMWSPCWRRRLPPDCDHKLQCLLLFSVPNQFVRSPDTSKQPSVHISCISKDDLKHCSDGHFYLTQDHILQVYDLEPQEGFAEPHRKEYRERLVQQPQVVACEWPFVTSICKADKYILLGNPGVGKSTLLNGLVGRNGRGQVRFKSGVSYGKGLTSVMQAELVRGICWMDVPGLADVELCRQAAQEIGRAFKQGGNFHVIFVVILECGRVRADDKATMLTVLEAVPELTSFAIVFNKLSMREKKDLEEGGDHWDQVQASLAFDRPKLMSNQVFFNSHDEDLHGVDDAVPELPIEFRNFVAGMIGNQVTTKRVADLNVDKFTETVAKLESALQEMRNDKLLMQAGLKAAEEQQANLQKEHQQLMEIADRRAAERLEAEMRESRSKYESECALLRAALKKIQADMNKRLEAKKEEFEIRLFHMKAKMKTASNESMQENFARQIQKLREEHAEEIRVIRAQARKDMDQQCRWGS